MSSITLSYLGMHNIDDTIFDGFQLPETVNRNTLITMILAETAELEALYPAPVLFAPALRAWSTARLQSWSRMALALSEDYNPLHNYDRTETESFAEETGGERAGTDSTTGTLTGFNSDTFNNDRKTDSATAIEESGTREHERTLRAYGNIGVTTSAQMLEGEIDVRRFDIYRIIADEFADYFCIKVY